MGGAGNSEGWGVRLGLNHTDLERWGPLMSWLGWLLSGSRLNLALGRCEGCWGRSFPWASGFRLPFAPLLVDSDVDPTPPAF